MTAEMCNLENTSERLVRVYKRFEGMGTSYLALHESEKRRSQNSEEVLVGLSFLLMSAPLLKGE